MDSKGYSVLVRVLKERTNLRENPSQSQDSDLTTEGTVESPLAVGKVG